MAYVNYLALNKLMSNVGGTQYDFDAVKSAYDSDAAVKSLIRNFDKNGIALNTDKKDVKDKVVKAKKTSVDQMALKAAKTHLKR